MLLGKILQPILVLFPICTIPVLRCSKQNSTQYFIHNPMTDLHFQCPKISNTEGALFLFAVFITSTKFSWSVTISSEFTAVGICSFNSSYLQ